MEMVVGSAHMVLVISLGVLNDEYIIQISGKPKRAANASATEYRQISRPRLSNPTMSQNPYNAICWLRLLVTDKKTIAMRKAMKNNAKAIALP